MVQNAIGGENVTTTIEGRERYPVNVRYMPDFRSDIGDLARLPVPASGGRTAGAAVAAGDDLDDDRAVDDPQRETGCSPVTSTSISPIATCARMSRTPGASLARTPAAAAPAARSPGAASTRR